MQHTFTAALLLCLSIQADLSAAGMQQTEYAIISVENAGLLEPVATIRPDRLENVTRITTSHDDSMLLLQDVVNYSLPLELWNLETLSLRAFLTPVQSEHIWETAFSLDDTAIAVRQSNLIQVWSADDATTLLTIEDFIDWMQFLPANNILAYIPLYWEDDILLSDSIHFWNYVEGRELLRLEHPGIGPFDVDSSGRYLVSGSRTDASVRLWNIDLSTGKYSYEVLHEGNGYSLAEIVGFIDTGLLFFQMQFECCRSPRILYLWDYQANEFREPLYNTTHTSWISGSIFMTLFPDASQDLRNNQLWDASSNTNLVLLTSPQSYRELNGDRTLVLTYTSSPNRFDLINIETGEVLKSIDMNIAFAGRIAFSSGGRYLLTWYNNTVAAVQGLDPEDNLITIWAVPER